jgi:hypothetical protein
MFTWLAERKKKIILGVIVAAIVAATGAPTVAVEAIATAIYNSFETSQPVQK